MDTMVKKNTILVHFRRFFTLLVFGMGLSYSEIRDHPQVHCETTKGPMKIEIYPEWSPIGAERFLALVADEFYTNIALFRCVKKFLVQFGISDNPIKKHWHGDNIPDDPNLHMGIKKNYLSFAGGGPNTRSTQLFIAFEDLEFLGNEPWETPFGKVIDGQDTLDHFYKGYQDIPPFGNGPDQQMIYSQGNSYIRSQFPHVDFIKSCALVDANLDPMAEKVEGKVTFGDAFVPEDDDKKVRDGGFSNPSDGTKEEDNPSRDSFGNPLVSNEFSEENISTEEQWTKELNDHGNLRDNSSDRLLPNEIVSPFLSKKDIIALRAMSILIVVAVGMFLYGKFYYSSSYAASTSKKQ